MYSSLNVIIASEARSTHGTDGKYIVSFTQQGMGGIFRRPKRRWEGYTEIDVKQDVRAQNRGQWRQTLYMVVYLKGGNLLTGVTTPDCLLV